MAYEYVDTKDVMNAIEAFDKARLKMRKNAYTASAPAPPPVTAQQGDPAAMQGDPAAMQGDPAAMQGGMPPQGDPSMQGGPPPDAQGSFPVGPEFEKLLASMSEGVNGLGEKVGNHDKQLEQLTERCLQLEQQLSVLKDGLKGPAGLEGQAPAAAPAQMA